MSQASTYTTELADEICERIANGETLRAICRDAHMPSWVTVYTWRKTYPQFAERLALAREIGGDAIAEEIIEITDDTANDTVVTENGERPNTEWIARSKLRAEMRLKLLAVWFPRKFGQRIDVTTGGESMNLSAEERAAKLQAIAAAAAQRRAQKPEDDGADLL
jgi:hypothetical protein